MPIYAQAQAQELRGMALHVRDSLETEKVG